MSQTPLTSEIQNLQTAIAALEAQRSILGDAVVETALKPLRERLAALHFHVDERKRVTILFADVSGFTAMSESLDPEDVTAIMNECFERLTTQIVHCGGTVDKYSGDAVMALFGAPRALENHEEMALRAALAMQTTLAQYSTELQSQRGFALRMRIGLNTGEVLAGLVGGTGFKDYTVMGDAVNLASRLEHACPIGRVMISATTARPLHALFDFEPARQITVKGKVEPITVYVAIGPKSERGRVRGFADLAAPLIGREADLAALQTVCDLAVRQQRWQVLTVSGEAGIGKSRLRREFIGGLTQQRPQVRVVVARCYTHTRSTSFHLLGEMLQALLGLNLTDPTAALLDQMRAGLRAFNPALSESELSYRLASVAATIGLPLDDDPLRGLEPPQRLSRIFLSLESVLLDAARQTLTLLVIEDLHWADEVSLLFLARFVSSVTTSDLADHAAILLALGRPPDDQRDPLALLWPLLQQPPCHWLELTTLSEAQARQLIIALLHSADLPDDLIDLIVARAQGNPFFVEEIIRLLVEEGTLRYERSTEQWQITRHVAELRVPDNVYGVLAARLDRLPPDDKRVAQAAAIVGRTFWQHLLADITAQPIDAPLLDLEERRLIIRLTESQIADDWEWLFRNFMVQEVAYRNVTKALRRQLHRLVAEWLETHLGDRREAFVPLIAAHYEQAETVGRALHYLTLAADQAARLFANRRVVDFATRALSLASDNVTRFDLLSRRHKAYGQLGERDAQWTDLQVMLELAEKLGDDRRRAQTLNNLGLVVRRRRELTRALDYHQQALALFRQSADQVGTGRCLNNIGTVYWLQGDTAQAFAHYEQALDLARLTGDQRDEGNSLTNIGTAYWQTGDTSRALEFYQLALPLHQAIGDRYNEGIDRTNLGEALRRLGDYPSAVLHLTTAVDVCQAIGDREGELEALHQLGLARTEAGQPVAALDPHTRALRLAQHMQQAEAEARAYYGLGLAQLECGDTDRARASLVIAHQLYEQRDSPEECARCQSALSQAHLRAGDPAQALASADRAVAWLGAQPDRAEAAPAIFFQRDRARLAHDATTYTPINLEQAYRYLLAQATCISDAAARQTFLHDVALHRHIIQTAAQVLGT